MISFHSVYVVALVSQATFTAVLFLLAWNDRQFHGLPALALSCFLHTIAIALNPLWRNQGIWLAQALALSLLPLMFFLIHTGLRAFFGYRAERPQLEATLLGTAMLLSFSLAHRHPAECTYFSLSCACVLLLLTIRMLRSTGISSVRRRARFTAGLLLLILVGFLARFPLEIRHSTARAQLILRELTMGEITLLGLSFIALYLAESKRRHHGESRRDALTGLPNRRAMEEEAAHQIALASRKGTPLALLMMDLDGFKILNDTWGHAVGDRALHAVGEVLLATRMPTPCSVARLGGEEFAMLLPGYNIKAAQAIAEDLCSAIANIVLREGSRRVPLTISIGVSIWRAGESSWTSTLRRADAALYRAKEGGRNRVAPCLETLESSVVLDGPPEDFTESSACALAD